MGLSLGASISPSDLLLSDTGTSAGGTVTGLSSLGLSGFWGSTSTFGLSGTSS